MAMGRPKAELVVSDEEQAQLQSIARSRSLPAALVRRANMVLACAAGATNSAVARRFGTTNATVGKWRQRFVARRIEGLHDELRPGKPRSIDDERIAALLNTTLHARPKDGTTHWSVRGLAAETGIAKTSVHRFLQAFGLQPHRRDSFKLSTDPFFIEKLRDVVGLYLNPPDKALVLCLDEKSQIQALERTQPLLPLGFGDVEGVTHDDLRHGTTTLFAALDLLDGTVLAQCRPRHRHQEFLSFLRAIEQAVPADLEIHVILDNYATHKHPKVKAWLAARPRWHLHFIPTYSSWLNLVERFFALISERQNTSESNAGQGPAARWCRARSGALRRARGKSSPPTRSGRLLRAAGSARAGAGAALKAPCGWSAAARSPGAERRQARAFSRSRISSSRVS